MLVSQVHFVWFFRNDFHHSHSEVVGKFACGPEVMYHLDAIGGDKAPIGREHFRCHPSSSGDFSFGIPFIVDLISLLLGIALMEAHCSKVTIIVVYLRSLMCVNFVVSESLAEQKSLV